MPEIHSQEGAAPGTAAGAPTDDAFRAIDPDTLMGEFDAEQQQEMDAELDDLYSSSGN